MLCASRLTFTLSCGLSFYDSFVVYPRCVIKKKLVKKTKDVFSSLVIFISSPGFSLWYLYVAPSTNGRQLK